MAYKTLIVELEDHVTVIRLNRPDALNALNTQLLRELGEALAEAEANEKVRCIILTGSEKAFAAGADIKEMSTKSFVGCVQRRSVRPGIRGDPEDPQADHRRGVGLCAWRGLRACDDVRLHHRVGHGEVRPARDQPRRRGGHGRDAAADALHRKVEGDGHAPDGPVHGRAGSGALGPREPCRAGEEADGRGDGRRSQDREKSRR